MAFHKATLAALKLLSHSSPDIKKTYKIHRQIVTLTRKPIIKPPYYKTWNHKLQEKVMIYLFVYFPLLMIYLTQLYYFFMVVVG